MDKITLTVVEHPQGSLMKIENDGRAIYLERDEAFELQEKLPAKLGEMPVKL